MHDRMLLPVIVALSLGACGEDSDRPKDDQISFTDLAGVKNISFDVDALSSHQVMSPKSYDIASGPLSRSAGSTIEIDMLIPPGMTTRLNVDGFIQEVSFALQRSTIGFAMQLQDHGEIVSTRQWRWARTPRDGDTGSETGILLSVDLAALLNDYKNVDLHKFLEP